jgi:hypothetical protein
MSKKLHWNQITKIYVILSVGNVHRLQRRTHSLFSSRLMQPAIEICVMERVHLTRYFRYVWHQKIGKCNRKIILASKNEMPVSVRQWTQVSLVKKTILQLDCWETSDGQVRAGYNILITFFWVKSPYGLVGRSQRFGEACCLQTGLKMERARFSETLVSTNQSTRRLNSNIIRIFTAVKTLNLANYNMT